MTAHCVAGLMLTHLLLLLARISSAFYLLVLLNDDLFSEIHFKDFFLSI